MPSPIQLQTLLKLCRLPDTEESRNVLISDLSYDSRLTKPGDLFFAIKGAHRDGHEFIEDVAKKGAMAAVVEHTVESSIPTVVTPSVLEAMSKISNAFFDEPSKRLPVIGVTGTNGKTTVTFLIEDIFRALGKVTGVMGTVTYRIGTRSWPAPNTTPMSLDVLRFIDEGIRSEACRSFLNTAD